MGISVLLRIDKKQKAINTKSALLILCLYASGERESGGGGEWGRGRVGEGESGGES
jgi:hypothetical protein